MYYNCNPNSANIMSLSKDRAMCLVCDMVVSKKTRFTTILKGRKYYFCCNECKSAFVKSPYEYAKV